MLGLSLYFADVKLLRDMLLLSQKKMFHLVKSPPYRKSNASVHIKDDILGIIL